MRACMHTYIHACMHTCIHACMHTCMQYITLRYVTLRCVTLHYVTLHYITYITYILTYLHTYMPTYLHTYLHTYIPTYLPAYLPTYIHTCILYMYTIIYIYIHDYTCIIGICTISTVASITLPVMGFLSQGGGGLWIDLPCWTRLEKTSPWGMATKGGTPGVELLSHGCHPWLGMVKLVTIAPISIKMLMTGGWFFDIVLPCFTHMTETTSFFSWD